jgi:hypothetical protein
MLMYITHSFEDTPAGLINCPRVSKRLRGDLPTSAHKLLLQLLKLKANQHLAGDHKEQVLQS